jgi:phosphonate transport system substrate-binding protein
MFMLRFSSYLGDNGRDFYAAVVAYLGQAIGLPVTMLETPPEQASAFALDQLAGAFTCGLPYVRHYAGAGGARPLAAMVMAAERYGDRPVYFSDVIVRAGAPFARLDDLRGARFAFNGTDSFSGYVLPRWHLITLGRDLDFFGAALESGSHARSMDWVEGGEADAAAIDSVVLEMELHQRPERAAAFRVIESIGPMPMPPLVAAARLGVETHVRLARALTAMHEDAAGRTILDGAGVRRFAAVSDRDYDAVREVWSRCSSAAA